jgi:hypothetical protein
MGAAEPTTPFFWFERKKKKMENRKRESWKRKVFGKMKL